MSDNLIINTFNKLIDLLAKLPWYFHLGYLVFFVIMVCVGVFIQSSWEVKK